MIRLGPVEFHRQPRDVFSNLCAVVGGRDGAIRERVEQAGVLRDLAQARFIGRPSRDGLQRLQQAYDDGDISFGAPANLVEGFRQQLSNVGPLATTRSASLSKRSGDTKRRLASRALMADR